MHAAGRELGVNARRSVGAARVLVNGAIGGVAWTPKGDILAVNELTSFGTTLLIIGVIHALLFTSIRAGVLSLVPNVIPIVYNFGIKGIRSVELYKRRLRRGESFPPFLFISVISGCQLRCQGCWVDVEAPRKMMDLETLNGIVSDAKRHGNSYFGILGGEPFLHPSLLDLLGSHPDCYFQIFTNGQLIPAAVARELRRLGNASPLVSIEGTAAVSDERRGRSHVLDRTLSGNGPAIPCGTIRYRTPRSRTSSTEGIWMTAAL